MAGDERDARVVFEEWHGESEHELHRHIGGVPTPIYMESVGQASGRPGSTEIHQAAEQ
ncbi:MAG: hypothetical protein OEV38_20655 [Nitrospira sp.]|jgi:hypothetical protein|nr:hypothetical protein [Nitrospira sp.]MDH4355132.1 hypothetical protein [Nitrospira sp.]MDH5320308.1 hypothetical protein [Nitrospira sp.]